VPGRLHVVEDVFDLAVRPNHERHPGNAFEYPPVHGLVFDHAKSLTDFLVSIGEQREGEVVLVLKLFLFGGTISRNAQYDGSRPLNLAVCVTEPGRFFRSTRSIGLGIEKQYDRLAPKILQGNFFTVLIRRTEVGGFIIDFHGILSS
jgi:hypothetical protein